MQPRNEVISRFEACRAIQILAAESQAGLDGTAGELLSTGRVSLKTADRVGPVVRTAARGGRRWGLPCLQKNCSARA